MALRRVGAAELWAAEAFKGTTEDTRQLSSATFPLPQALSSNRPTRLVESSDLGGLDVTMFRRQGKGLQINV